MKKQIAIRLGDILYEKLPGGKYLLLENYTFDTGIRIKKAYCDKYKSMRTTGRLHIRKGYIWNGANGVPDTDEVMRGSLVHDALCEIYHKGYLNKLWITRMNDIFTVLCREDGMSGWLCKLYRLGLRIFWKPRK